MVVHNSMIRNLMISCSLVALLVGAAAFAVPPKEEPQGIPAKPNGGARGSESAADEANAQRLSQAVQKLGLKPNATVAEAGKPLRALLQKENYSPAAVKAVMDGFLGKSRLHSLKLEVLDAVRKTNRTLTVDEARMGLVAAQGMGAYLQATNDPALVEANNRKIQSFQDIIDDADPAKRAQEAEAAKIEELTQAVQKLGLKPDATVAEAGPKLRGFLQSNGYSPAAVKAVMDGFLGKSRLHSLKLEVLDAASKTNRTLTVDEARMGLEAAQGMGAYLQTTNNPALVEANNRKIQSFQDIIDDADPAKRAQKAEAAKIEELTQAVQKLALKPNATVAEAGPKLRGFLQSNGYSPAAVKAVMDGFLGATRLFSLKVSLLETAQGIRPLNPLEARLGMEAAQALLKGANTPENKDRVNKFQAAGGKPLAAAKPEVVPGGKAEEDARAAAAAKAKAEEEARVAAAKAKAKAETPLGLDQTLDLRNRLRAMGELNTSDPERIRALKEILIAEGKIDPFFINTMVDKAKDGLFTSENNLSGEQQLNFMRALLMSNRPEERIQAIIDSPALISVKMDFALSFVIGDLQDRLVKMSIDDIKNLTFGFFDKELDVANKMFRATSSNFQDQDRFDAADGLRFRSDAQRDAVFSILLNRKGEQSTDAYKEIVDSFGPHYGELIAENSHMTAAEQVAYLDALAKSANPKQRMAELVARQKSLLKNVNEAFKMVGNNPAKRKALIKKLTTLPVDNLKVATVVGLLEEEPLRPQISIGEGELQAAMEGMGNSIFALKKLEASRELKEERARIIQNLTNKKNILNPLERMSTEKEFENVSSYFLSMYGDYKGTDKEPLASDQKAHEKWVKNQGILAREKEEAARSMTGLYMKLSNEDKVVFLDVVPLAFQGVTDNNVAEYFMIKRPGNLISLLDNEIKLTKNPALKRRMENILKTIRLSPMSYKDGDDARREISKVLVDAYPKDLVVRSEDVANQVWRLMKVAEHLSMADREILMNTFYGKNIGQVMNAVQADFWSRSQKDIGDAFTPEDRARLESEKKSAQKIVNVLQNFWN